MKHKHKMVKKELKTGQKYLKCKCGKVSFLEERPRGNKKYKGCFGKCKVLKEAENG